MITFLCRFNANVSYSGLLHAVTQEHLFAENKEKLISSAISSLISKEGDQDSISSPELEQQFHCLRRLVASKAGFSCFTSLPGFREKVGWKVAKALKRGDDGISHAAIDMLCALMEPMHQEWRSENICYPFYFYFKVLNHISQRKLIISEKKKNKQKLGLFPNKKRISFE